MGNNKKERRLTVSYSNDGGYKQTPFLRLKGHWLRDGGFLPGTRVNVLVLQDKLVVTKDVDFIKKKKREMVEKLEQMRMEVSQLEQELINMEDDFLF